MILAPMAEKGEEPIGSMGTDTPLACLSDKPQPLFNYFKQLFAQVTNPPIDPDSRRDGDVAHQLHRHRAQHPGRDAAALPHAEAAASHPHQPRPGKTAPRLAGRFPGHHAAHAVPAWRRARRAWSARWTQLCRRASLAIKTGYTLLILSDRGVDEDYAPIPSLLALTAVHNHLVREETRTQVALIVESGEPREVMHFALLIGYGASAVNPYLAIETLEDMARRGVLPNGVTFEKALEQLTTRPSTRAC